MPKSAYVMQQSHAAQHTEPDQEAVEHELAGKLQQLAGIRIFLNIPYFGSGSLLYQSRISILMN
jgi:hypothetical protein